MQQGEFAGEVAAQQVDLRLEALFGFLQGVPQVGIVGGEIRLGDRVRLDLGRPEGLGNVSVRATTGLTRPAAGRLISNCEAAARRWPPGSWPAAGARRGG